MSGKDYTVLWISKLLFSDTRNCFPDTGVWLLPAARSQLHYLHAVRHCPHAITN